MFRLLLILAFSYCRIVSPAQSGPAGVGSSTSNVFWLKADKGTSSSVNNTPISAWNDQSGNGINVTQTVTAQQPSFATNVINGMPAIQFDNVSTTNDKMIGPDSPILDNTAGYSFFTVTRPQNLDGNARVIVSKRTTVSVDQSFMLFYYSSNRLYVDIQTTDNRFNSAFTFTSGNNYITDVIYDGTLASGSRSRLYTGETLDVTASESATLVPDNTSPIILGTTDATDPRPYGGYIAEVIIYRTALLPAQRIIVNNYLSAKYNIALAANDKYAGDNNGNGDYDLEVAGIGQESTGNNNAFSTSVSGGMGLTATSGLDNTDYVLAGHAVPVNALQTTDVGGMTGANNGRWQRVWYIDITNTSTAISANIQFGATDGGMGSAPLGTTAANYVLLYRAGQTGNWTELATANSVVGDRAFFNNISLTADGYYTLGSKNHTLSVLPVELVDFAATPEENKVTLRWNTSSEKNNAGFEIEKTKDGAQFETVALVKGAGNSSSSLHYSSEDLQPYRGLSYYRLKQSDHSGKITYSRLAAVYYDVEAQSLTLYPNPAEGTFYISSRIFEDSRVTVQIIDSWGRTCFNKIFSPAKNTVVIDTENKLPGGSYFVLISAGEKTYMRRIILR
ncbi:MAG: T9SS type A sorting domain-containing protein [Bacteroidota bacterium]